MKFDVKELVVNMKKRGENLEKSPIGSKLKYKRRQLNLTLEEGSQDICSVSYLSKVENNLIKPTKRYVSLLKEKYQMDFIDEDQKTFECELENLLYDYYFDISYESKKMDKPYEDYQQFLKHFAYYMMSDQHDIALKLFHDLVLFIPNMPTRSFNFLLILTSRLLYEDLRFSDAKDMLHYMTIDDDEIVYLIQQKWLLKIASKLNTILRFEAIYDEYKERLIKLQYFNEIPEIELERKLLFKNISTHDINQLDQNNTKLIIIAIKGLFESQLHQKVIEIAPKFMKNPDILVYYLRSLEILNETKALKNIMREINAVPSDYKTANLIFNHLKHKHLCSNNEQLEYMRTEILSLKHLTDEVNVLNYFMHDAFELFRKNFYYKEASDIMSKYLPKIKQLNQN